jgi:hypothetical protein
MGVMQALPFESFQPNPAEEYTAAKGTVKATPGSAFLGDQDADQDEHPRRRARCGR